jgi:hypothetical protein
MQWEVTMTGASVADRAVPGELMRLVVDGLAAKGAHVRWTEPEDRCSLTIPGHDARCEFSVSDTGYVEWECSPRTGDDVDPKRLADLATTLLTGQEGSHARQGGGYSNPSITLKGIVGLEARIRGLEVDLEVYEDATFSVVMAEIVVTNPDTRELASVRVTDDGALLWQRDYWPEAATITWEPEYSAEITDPGKVANSIVNTIMRAIAL